jgi:hypothetical protein
MERSITVRAFGIPDNREVGVMLHGYDERRRFHYSYGVVNGDGPGFKNADSQFDSIGRAWIAPFAFLGDGPLRDATIGGSAWLGDRENTVAPAAQTTQGGFAFLRFDPQVDTFAGSAGATTVQLRQVGLLRAYAGELNVPIAHRVGVRGEFVWRHSPLSEENVGDPSRPVILGGANLIGWSAYGEAWGWVWGDDRIVGDRQGLEPFKRWRGGAAPGTVPGDGLMVAVRVEHLDEDVTHERDAVMRGIQSTALGNTQVTSATLGVNYWHSRRFRATFNYTFNHFQGDTTQIQNLPSLNLHELGVRLAIAL